MLLLINQNQVLIDDDAPEPEKVDDPQPKYPFSQKIEIA